MASFYYGSRACAPAAVSFGFHAAGDGCNDGEEQFSYGMVVLPMMAADHDDSAAQRSLRWQRIIAQVGKEYADLPVSEKVWIDQRLVKIADLQLQLHQLFERGGGYSACAGCRGECCRKGHNHMTLANLLGFFRLGLLPPEADFASTCPFLGRQGCLLEVAQRPYNCISFVCDIIEKILTSAEVETFYALEQQLRTVYLEFAERYAGAGMTGLLLQSERLQGRSFLELKDTGNAVSG